MAKNAVYITVAAVISIFLTACSENVSLVDTDNSAPSVKSTGLITDESVEKTKAGKSVVKACKAFVDAEMYGQEDLNGPMKPETKAAFEEYFDAVCSCTAAISVNAENGVDVMDGKVSLNLRSSIFPEKLTETYDFWTEKLGKEGSIYELHRRRFRDSNQEDKVSEREADIWYTHRELHYLSNTWDFYINNEQKTELRATCPYFAKHEKEISAKF